MLPINSLTFWSSIILVFYSIPVVLSEKSTYSSELTTNHPTWPACFSEGPVFYYEAIHLNIAVEGYVLVTSNVNICGFLYKGSFNPENHIQYLVMNSCDDDDIDKPFSFIFKAKLDHYYILVVTSRGHYETKSFTITADSFFGVVGFQRVADRITTTAKPIVTTSLSSVDNNNDDVLLRSFITQMLGSDTNLTVIIGKLILTKVTNEEKGFKERMGKALLSNDLEERLKALEDMRERIERILLSQELANDLMEEQLFTDLQKASLENIGVNGNAIQIDKGLCNFPISDIGKKNGLYGSGSTLTMKEEMVAGYEVAIEDPKVKAMKLGMIDLVFPSVPDPESRLGAYYATRGYKSGTVGSAVHGIIRGMYLILGPLGEEKIGRIYNNPDVKALFSQPVQSTAMRCLANIEQLYFTNVKKENPESIGARLVSVVTPRARECITDLLSGILCSSI